MAVVTEKWKVMESLLKDIGCLRRYHYKYLGMNYSSNAALGRLRFEYIFRNQQTVWINFSYYPETRTEPACLNAILVSPFMRDELNLNAWVSKYSHNLDLSRFSQFTGEFKDQATALIALLDKTLSRCGLEAVLSGRSAVDVPSLHLKA